MLLWILGADSASAESRARRLAALARRWEDTGETSFLLSAGDLQHGGEAPHLCSQGLRNGRHEWEAGDSYSLPKSREGGQAGQLEASP